ncbi:MAG: ATP-dependent sacrificial sulfur transferase LarE [archaeon]
MRQSRVLKLERLKKHIEKSGDMLIAFSGGVDSTFLARVAHDVLGDRAVAVTATSSTYPKRELLLAKRLAREIGIRHMVIESLETEIPSFRENLPDRCYHCKKELFSKLKEVARKENIGNVADATNVDDLTDHRPGMRAKEELGVVSPLLDAGMTKDDIRSLSKDMGLYTWNKPAFACLASRFPYGTEITRDRLSVVERAEDIIRGLGVVQSRVRYHGNMARIEVCRADMQKVLDNSGKLAEAFLELGFVYVCLDLMGYRTGSMNEVLENGEDA